MGAPIAKGSAEVIKEFTALFKNHSEAAKELGVAASTLSAWVKGSHEPSRVAHVAAREYLRNRRRSENGTSYLLVAISSERASAIAAIIKDLGGKYIKLPEL